MTGFGTPDEHPPEEEVLASERVAEARHEVWELSQDGQAPSVEAVLREMGRDSDGYPIEEGPDEFVPASEAARRALPDLDVEQS